MCDVGAVTFVFSSGVSTENTTVTYSTPIVNTDLKVPTLGITDTIYTINRGAMEL